MNYENLRALYQDALTYNQKFLSCVIMILLEKQEVSLTDSIPTFYSVLEKQDVIQLIRSHPAYREYRQWHVDHLKDLEKDYPNPNEQGFYKNLTHAPRKTVRGR